MFRDAKTSYFSFKNDASFGYNAQKWVQFQAFLTVHDIQLQVYALASPCLLSKHHCYGEQVIFQLVFINDHNDWAKSYFIDLFLSSHIYLQQFQHFLQTQFAHLYSAQKFAQLQHYRKLIQIYHHKYNLTSLVHEACIWSELFANALVPFKDLVNTNQTIVDLGTGSGIPGVLLQIMFERCHVSLVESNAKKVGFLKQVKLALNLVNLSVCHQRAEILTIAQRDYFDVVTMRAVGKLSQWLEILAVYVKVQGLLMIPKSLSLLTELAAVNDYAQFKLALLRVETVTGLHNKTINTVIFRKFAVSPTIFPRSWQQLVKVKK